MADTTAADPKEHPASPGGSEAEARGDYGEAPTGASAGSEERSEKVGDMGGDDAGASSSGGVMQSVQPHVDWARREVTERSAYLADEARRRPWQSGAFALAIWCLLCALVAVSGSWIELHVETSVGDISGHTDLSNIWTCVRRDRTTYFAGYDCAIYSFVDAPRALDDLGAATGAAVAFCAIGFLCCLSAAAVTLLQRLDRVNFLGALAGSLGSRTGAIVLHAVAALCFLVAFAAFSGGANQVLADPVKARLLARGFAPTATWYGAGFAFAIIAWLSHVACAVVLYMVPESEFQGDAPRAPAVGTSAAAAPAGTSVAEPDEESAAGDYSHPLTTADDDEHHSDHEKDRSDADPAAARTEADDIDVAV